MLKSTMDYLKRLKLLEHRNIIENLLIDLKRAVCARWPKNIAELKAFCKKEQEKILNGRTEVLLTGCKKHWQAVKASKGSLTENFWHMPL